MLKRDHTYTCPSCTASTKVRGDRSDLLACPRCGAIVENNTGNVIPSSPLPGESMAVHIGSTGVYKERKFEVIGLVHLQLKRDYKNIWCLWMEKDRAYAWLVESFGMYTYCADTIFEWTEGQSLSLNKPLKIGQQSTVTIDAIDQCEQAQYGGELHGWKDFNKGFITAQGNSNSAISAFFIRPEKNKIRFLLGEWVEIQNLNLMTTRKAESAVTAPFNYPCPECKKNNVLRGRSLTRALTCNSCGSYFTTDPSNDRIVTFKEKNVPALPIGGKAKINGDTYEVMGFAVKYVQKYRYRWREYTLYAPAKGVIFLSEYDGHWNLMLPRRDNPNPKANREFHFEGENFRLYQKFKAILIDGKGEFFSDVYGITGKTSGTEYIAPPFLLSLESDPENQRWYKGEYKSQGEIAAAFGISTSQLPIKAGRGYTQPLLASFRVETLAWLCVLMAVLIFGIQVFFEMNAAEKVVYQNTYHAGDLTKDQKMLVTPSFDLEGASKSLVVRLTAPINNDWFSGEFTLVNDSDQTEYNFSKDIEYYRGYEDGESWSEGSVNGEAFLSKIAAGRYHLNIYPEFSLTNNEFSIVIIRDLAAMSNMWIALILAGVFPAYYFIRRYTVERQRWSDSDYSPYDDD